MTERRCPHRLPDGSVSYDPAAAIDAWIAETTPLERLGWTMLGFDPGVSFIDSRGVYGSLTMDQVRDIIAQLEQL